MIKEPEFLKRIFQHNIQGQYGKTVSIFPVTVVHAKETGKMKFDPLPPKLEYQHENSNFLFLWFSLCVNCVRRSSC